MKAIQFQDLGLMRYQQAWDYQEILFSQLVERKTSTDIQKEQAFGGTFLFVEHPHVFTLGKSGHSDNLLVNEEYLHSKGASFYQTNRGGDITYHGPGQIVGYPILDLDFFQIGVREYINRMEETVIRTLKHYGIHAGRLNGATGVWLDADNVEKSRKICAIGVRTSRGVTMHGFAFNVNTDLSFYNLINPCGFTDRGVTSMKNELERRIDIAEVKSLLLKEFLASFDASVDNAVAFIPQT